MEDCLSQCYGNDPANQGNEVDAVPSGPESESRTLDEEDENGSTHKPDLSPEKNAVPPEPEPESETFDSDAEGQCPVLRKQSPIDIISNTARYQEYRPFELKNYENFSMRKHNLMATNTGGTLKLLVYGDDDLPILKGGPLNVAYEFVEMHFHWGEDDSDNGSEHKIDGKGTPLELHIVHKNIHDATIGEALTYENGLAVLGFKFALVNDEVKIHPAMDTLTKLAKQHLIHPGVNAKEETLSHQENVALVNFLPLVMDEYFHYRGSLTTGDYNEAVNWVVFNLPLAVHEENLYNLQSLMDKQGNRLINNFRPVQPVCGRPLYYHGTEFLKAGVISKGNEKTVRSHKYPNQGEYLLTVPGPVLLETAPLAMSGIVYYNNMVHYNNRYEGDDNGSKLKNAIPPGRGPEIETLNKETYEAQTSDGETSDEETGITT